MKSCDYTGDLNGEYGIDLERENKYVDFFCARIIIIIWTDMIN